MALFKLKLINSKKRPTAGKARVVLGAAKSQKNTRNLLKILTFPSGLVIHGYCWIIKLLQIWILTVQNIKAIKVQFQYKKNILNMQISLYIQKQLIPCLNVKQWQWQDHRSHTAGLHRNSVCSTPGRQIAPVWNHLVHVVSCLEGITLTAPKGTEDWNTEWQSVKSGSD